MMRHHTNEVKQLVRYIQERFAVSPQEFLESIRLSPNSQGGIIGAITEYLLMKHLREQGFLVERIPEKWEGQKLHHGDFYVSKGYNQPAYILESKGLKSNAEAFRLGGSKSSKRMISVHKLIRELRYYYDMLVEKESFPKNASDQQKKEHLAKFIVSLFPNLKTDLSSLLDAKKNVEIDIDELTDKLRLLVSHFVSSKSSGSRKQNTPSKSEFHIVAVNLFIKIDEHKFIYAPVTKLPQGKTPGHLKQNYLIGLAYRKNTDEKFQVCFDRRIWTESFSEVFSQISKASKGIPPEKKYVDKRAIPDR